MKKLAESSDEVTAARASAVIMSADGIHTPEIASSLGVCERTIRNTINSFNKVGCLAVTRKTPPGRPRILGDEQREALIELIHTSPFDSG